MGGLSTRARSGPGWSFGGFESIGIQGLGSVA